MFARHRVKRLAMQHLQSILTTIIVAITPVSQAVAWNMTPTAPMNSPMTVPTAPMNVPPTAPVYGAVPPPVVAPTAVTIPQPPMFSGQPGSVSTQSVDPTPVTSSLDNTDLPPPPPGGWQPIRDVIYTAAANRQPIDVFTSRVPNGQSCVDASTDRATAIFNALQQTNANTGALNNYQVEVGTMSGYQVLPGSGNDIAGGTSMHTFTVVTFTDKNTGKQVAYEVDNYFMPTYTSPTTPPRNGDPQYQTIKTMNEPGRSR
jgi:hypothetical protein